VISSRIGFAFGFVVDQLHNAHFFRPSLATSFPSSQPGLTRTDPPNIQVLPDEKFLSYLPHSGFHNQRIALENALVLARLLNRTLLVPPVRFGRRAIPYRNFTVLQHMLDTNYTAYLCQLSESAANRNTTIAMQGTLLDFPDLPDRCALERKRKPVAYTYLPWDWITDFDSIRRLQSTIQTLGSTQFWLPSRFDPHTHDVLVIPDASEYQYRFVDGIASNTSSSLTTSTDATYSEDIALIPLASHPAKLIQLGSLFGSRRLKLSDPVHKAIRKQIRRHMSLKHPLLQKSSADIATRVSGSGSGFIGAHLRFNDRYFLASAAEHSRMIWWKLVHEILGLSIEHTHQLELGRSTTGNGPGPLSSEQFISPSKSPIHLPLDNRTLTIGVGSTRNCKGELHSDPKLERLNIPLFIATDSKDPNTDEHLRLFRQTFPCVFFLGDFPQEVEQITAIRDPISGVEIGDMLVPFLDAMVVARAARVVGTPHSTFSWYVQDVLWRVNHGLDIEEPGGG